MSNKSFSEILDNIGHSDKNTCHGYGKYYDYWLPEWRAKATDILELGVCVFGGGCVRAFAEYFPNATIWAADIDNTRCCPEVFSHPRIKFLHGDVYTQEFLDKVKGVKFDIIADDASHEIDMQLKALKMLRSQLKDDGMYIIEDVCTKHLLPRLSEIWDLGLQQTIVNMETKKHYDSTIVRMDVVKESK